MGKDKINTICHIIKQWDISEKIQFNKFVDDIFTNSVINYRIEYQSILDNENLNIQNFYKSTIYNMFREYTDSCLKIHSDYIVQKNKLKNIIDEINRVSLFIGYGANIDRVLIPFHLSNSSRLNYFEINIKNIEVIFGDNEKTIKKYELVLNKLKDAINSNNLNFKKNYELISLLDN